jgi:hypothetical protein
MRKLLSLICLAGSLAFSVPALADTSKCTYTLDQFIADVSAVKEATLYSMQSTGREKWLQLMNSNNPSDTPGQPKYYADAIYFALAGDQAIVTLSWQGCTIGGTVLRMDATILFSFFQKAGIVSSDMVKY